MSFAEAGKKIEEGVASGLYTAGTTLMAMSQELVPVDTATLKRSGRVEEPVVDGDHIEITVGYGYGGDYEQRATENNPDGKGYGFWVHQRVYTESGEKVKHAPPTQAKFLSDPARALEPVLGEFVQEGVRARLERG